MMHLMNAARAIPVGAPVEPASDAGNAEVLAVGRILKCRHSLGDAFDLALGDQLAAAMRALGRLLRGRWVEAWLELGAR